MDAAMGGDVAATQQAISSGANVNYVGEHVSCIINYSCVNTY